MGELEVDGDQGLDLAVQSVQELTSEFTSTLRIVFYKYLELIVDRQI